MRTEHIVAAIEQKACEVGKQWPPAQGSYPTDIVDLIIFHKLHLAMPVDAALRSFRRLKQKFVDWNEVRVSTVREIQEELGGASESLSLAVFVKELLEFVHRQRQRVSLEFLVEQNLTEIRRYLKKVRGLDASTVNLILRLRKEYPVLPLDSASETVIGRLGALRAAQTRDKKERALHDLVEPENALTVHHFLINHSRERCPPDENQVDCAHCCMRKVCAFYAQTYLRRKRVAQKNSRSRGTSAAGRRGRGAAVAVRSRSGQSSAASSRGAGRAARH